MIFLCLVSVLFSLAPLVCAGTRVASTDATLFKDSINLEDLRALMESGPAQEELLVSNRVKLKASADGGGFRFVAQERIEREEEILQVPMAAVLTWEFVAQEYPAFRRLFLENDRTDRNASAGPLPEESIFGYFLAIHLRNATARPHPALALLQPKCVDGSDYITAVKLLFPTGSYERMFGWLEGEVDRFHDLERRLEEIYYQDHLGAPPAVSWHDYQWGTCVMRTRANQMAEVHWSTFGKTVLIPLAEYFPHHHTQQNVAYEYDPATRVWHFKAKVPIEPGDRLYVSFGCRSKIDFLRQYGFVPRNDTFCGDMVLLNHTELFLGMDGNIVFGDFGQSDWDSYERVHHFGTVFRAHIASFPPIGQRPDHIAQAIWDEVVYLREETIKFVQRIDFLLRAREFDIRPPSSSSRRRRQKQRREEEEKSAASGNTE